ncbi:unnamed protein product, partial [Rhizophagus irregularis]
KKSSAYINDLTFAI